MNIYAGNLDFRLDEDNLKDIFKEYGMSSERILQNRNRALEKR